MRRRELVLAWAGAVVLSACQSLSRFDTKDGEAYCGSIVHGQFVRTTEAEGGFSPRLQLRVEIDADALTTNPGTLTSDDAAGGPCAPSATFDEAKLTVTPELIHDPFSTMTFADGQVHNVVGWVDSTCRGRMLAILSLYKNDRVEVRLLKPSDPPTSPNAGRDAFALFQLTRRSEPCGF